MKSLIKTVIVTSAIQAIATSIDIFLGIFASVIIGSYMFKRFFFINHPLTYLYDVSYFLSLIFISSLSSLLYLLICHTILLSGLSCFMCSNYDTNIISYLHLSIMFSYSLILWLFIKLPFWFQIWRQKTKQK